MEWIRGPAIGHGSFSTVNLAIAADLSTPFAVKSSAATSAAATAALINEKEVLTKLSPSPYIIRILGEGHSIENSRSLYNLFLEYASAGTLSEMLTRFPSGLPECDTRRYTRAVAEALRHVHGAGYAHCDIKPMNILLFSSGGGVLEAKVADFGLAKPTAAMGGGGGRGTPMYMAPEEVAGEDGGGAAADVWALGCTVAEMARGEVAWGREAAEGGVFGLIRRIGGGETPLIPASLSEEGRDFLRKCFVRDPRRRWTAEMLLNHPFLEKYEGSCKGSEEEVLASSSPTAPFDFPPPSTARWPELQSRSVWSPETAETAAVAAETVVTKGKRRIEELVSECRDCCWSAEACDDGWVVVR